MKQEYSSFAEGTKFRACPKQDKHWNSSDGDGSTLGKHVSGPRRPFVNANHSLKTPGRLAWGTVDDPGLSKVLAGSSHMRNVQQQSTR